jgi:hypothetical protein
MCVSKKHYFQRKQQTNLFADRLQLERQSGAVLPLNARHFVLLISIKFELI